MVCIRERPRISYGRSLALHFRYLTCLLDRGHITNYLVRQPLNSLPQLLIKSLLFCISTQQKNPQNRSSTGILRLDTKLSYDNTIYNLSVNQ